MKFKKGTKVEVLSTTKVPSGSWLCAEIICGNGHYYTIRYDGYQGAAGEAIVEHVSREAIRPCPPALEVMENWGPGDVVEVFQNFSWKMATILKVLGRNHVLVRLLGSSLEFQVDKSKIRVRQSWQDKKWILVGKDSACCENEKHDSTAIPRNKLISSAQKQRTDLKFKLSINKDNISETKETFLESHTVASKSLKRQCHSQIEKHAEPPLKIRAIKNEGKCHPARITNPSSTLKQLDGVIFPRYVLPEECIPSSVNNRNMGISDMDIERSEQSGSVGFSFGENLDSDDADSVTCSVGSCSISRSNSYRLHCPVYAGTFEGVDSPLSDAESVYPRRYQKRDCLPPRQEELAEEIHRLELHAYRRTIEALHASGPLSWEQEELITNLRLSLHISNDEHLIELRNLISSENSIPVR